MKTRSGGPYECSRRSPPHVTDDCLSIYVVIMGSISWGDPQAMNSHAALTRWKADLQGSADWLIDEFGPKATNG